MRRTVAIFLCTLILDATIYGEDSKKEKSPKYTLNALIERAMETSDWLSSWKARVEEKRFSAAQAGRWSNPELGLTGGRKKNSLAQGAISETSLSQPFFFPGKIGLRRGIANLEIDLASLEQNKAQLAFAYDVMGLAFQHAINHQKVVFSRERKKRFELIKSYLAGRPFATPDKIAERRVVESRLRDLSVESIEIETALQSTLENLKLYASLEGAADLEIEVPVLKGGQEVDSSQWREKAARNNPDIVAQRALVERTRREQSLAERERWPDFAVSVFSDKETAGEPERSVGAGFTLALPIFNLNTGNIKSAGKKMEAEEYLLRFQERELQSRLRQAMNELEAARKNVLLYPLSLFPEMEQQIKEAEEEFRKGRLDLLLFLELDGQTAETYYHALDAQVNLVEKLANFFSLAGENNLQAQLEKF